jgi:mannose-6-phosphate isomerase-like protein (cupin superfamily)
MEKSILVSPPQSRRLKSAKITLSPGEEIGEHITENREEIILVLRGEGILIDEGICIPLKGGHVHHIKQNSKHNVKNTSSKDLEYVYVVSLS